MLIAIVAALIFFLVPMEGAVARGGVNAQSGPNYYIKYERSLSCQFLGIGIFYWDESFALGCAGPTIP